MAFTEAPVKVSPLIKAGRWSFLFVGIWWGLAKERFLSARENRIREADAKKKQLRDAQIALEKASRH